MDVQKINDLFNKYTITSETDVKGLITYVSQPFIDISGYSKEELLGCNHRLIRHTDMKDDVFKEMWRIITNKQIWSGEVKNRKKNGGYYWVESVVFPIISGDKIVGYKSIRVDITARKKEGEILNSLMGEDQSVDSLLE